MVIEMEIKEQMDLYFGIVEDTRDKSYITYKMNDILFIVLCGMLSGCTEIERIVEYAEEKIEFLQKYIDISEIPCVATFYNILGLIKPSQLEISFLGILRNTFNKKEERQICIDGKTICSTSTMKNHEKPMHVVSALIADYGISFGQIVVESKSNEIPAVRKLIQQLDIKGAIVTLDAMHCQKETAELIIKEGGDYVLQLKGNQGRFYEDVVAMFDEKFMDINDKEENYETYQTIEKSHGRIEKRTCLVLNEIEFFTDYIAEWKGLKKIFAVKREVEKDGKKTKEISCYLSSKNTSAEKLLKYTRKHWQIESFHWLLDMNYDEDENRVRNKGLQETLNIARKTCITMHKNYIANHKLKRKTIVGSMYRSLLNDGYLEDIIKYNCNNSII